MLNHSSQQIIDVIESKVGALLMSYVLKVIFQISVKTNEPKLGASVKCKNGKIVLIITARN